MTDVLSDNAVILINKSEIIGVVRCALSKIDPRLIEHGERVAYIAEELRREYPRGGGIDPSRLFVLSVLHDIGAYKAEEIDDMVRFESDTAFDHALYGYLFLKNTAHLAAYAEAILYHHTDYSAPALRACPVADYAELICLADRCDILINARDGDFTPLKRLSGSKFNPAIVEALLSAEAKRGLSDSIRTGRYLNHIAELSDSLELQNHEIMEYLKLLVYAIDFRSPYTVTHTADTTLISLETGRLLGLNDHDLQALYIGAFLHDIGKIAIPHDILEKPGKLTPEEFDIVKRHIPEGEQILRGVVSDEICNIALRHHEKLDGSGYSRGLTKAELTLPERIVAVADILSALSQRRSYKEPFPKPEVVAILAELRDSGKLCPRVVDTVIANYDMILSRTEQSHDPLKTLYSGLRREYEALSAGKEQKGEAYEQ